MKTLKLLHNESMDIAELAMLAKLRGDFEESNRLFKEALKLELEAINTFEKTEISEPTYSILHRSAATLALDCNDHRKAEQIVAKALSHEPPAEIAEELRDLLEQINFRRHLLLRGVTLGEDEMQMSLAGKGVGFGVINSEEFLQRIENASKIIYRIVECRQKKPFRNRGRIPKSLKEDYEVFVSVPRAASFSVTLKLGWPVSQKKLLGFSSTSEIVDEFMGLMDLVNRNALKELERHIPDEAYLRNFIGLSKLIAPDGENIKLVGFTTTRKGEEKFVEVTKQRKEINIPKTSEQPADEFTSCSVKGLLLFADATQAESGFIKIVDETTKEFHLIKVPEGMMDDIVKPLWDSTVIVTGRKEGRYILLEDIQEE